MTGALPYGGHHLGPTGRVFGEEPARGGGEGGRAGTPSVGGRHAGVLGLAHQEGAAGAEAPVQRVGHLGGKALLELGPGRVALDEAHYLGEANDPAGRGGGRGRGPAEGGQRAPRSAIK